LTLTVICGLLGPAQAALAGGASATHAETEGAAMRILLAPAGPDGTLRGALDITLEPGWKTYWRDPGDGGIPPAVTVMPAGTDIPLGYPAPRRISAGGVTFAGYEAGVTLPFTLPAGTALPARLSAFVGVCSTICVPFQADFMVDVDPAAASRVARAFAALPAAATEETGLASAAIENGVLVMRAQTSPGADVFLAAPRGLVPGVPEAKPEGFSAPVLKDDGTATSIRYTLVRPGGAVEGEIAIAR
jgi:DsbC/DsbD-like thiol-disulfide interchange protein